VSSPDPIDVHVGLRIRQRRRLPGMRQEALGAAVGLSFQMVLKYEIGSNSVPASRLFEVAKALDVSPSFFFEGSRLKAKAPLYTRETIKLV
jgi:transcriptional regulator with XRE-family HTH domain